MLGILKDMGLVREISPHTGQKPAIDIFPKLMQITEGVDIG